MPVLETFTGGFNVQRSPNVDVERTINWFPEASAGTNVRGKVQWSLQPTVSVEPYVVCGNGPVRGIFAQDGRAFCVSGAFFYEFFNTKTSIVRGSVTEDGQTATISSNGKAGEQLFITSGGNGYIFGLDDDSFVEIPDPAFPTTARSGLFFDGFFVVLDARSGAFQLSALEDGLVWDSLNYGIVSQFSDTVIAMNRTHDNLYLSGTKNSQAWYNAGSPNFPFAPVPGGTIEHGIAAPFGFVECDNTAYYLGRDEHGEGAVWKLQGYTPVEVSTQAIRYKLSQATNLEQALAWSYQWQRHIFYVLYVPSLDTHLVYDVASEQWHEWALWDASHFHWLPHVGRCHAYGFNRHLIGDRQSGAIYTFNESLGVDRLVWSGPPVNLP